METEDPLGDPEATTPAILTPLKHLTPQSEENVGMSEYDVGISEVFDVFNEPEYDDLGRRILTKRHPTPEPSPSPPRVRLSPSARVSPSRTSSSPSRASSSPSRACPAADASNVSANRSRSLFGSQSKKGIGKGGLRIGRKRFLKEVDGTNMSATWKTWKLEEIQRISEALKRVVGDEVQCNRCEKHRKKRSIVNHITKAGCSNIQPEFKLNSFSEFFKRTKEFQITTNTNSNLINAFYDNETL